MESKAKNVSNGAKNVREHNLFQIEQKLLLKEQKMFVNENGVQSENINALYFSCRFSWLCLAFCELAWFCILRLLLGSCMAFYGFLWSCMAVLWSFLVFDGQLSI